MREKETQIKSVCVCVWERERERKGGSEGGRIEASFYERNVLLYKIPPEISEEKLLAKNDHLVFFVFAKIQRTL